MVELIVEVDENVKNDAQKACEEIGISLSCAINIFLKKLAREQKMPFNISDDL